LRIAATASASSRARRAIERQMLQHERDVPANRVKTRMFHARKRIGELMAAKGLNRRISRF
jgi:hypothetical protein